MIFKNIKRWKVCKDTEGLLFLAQRLDELLWDYTLDSYKPASLNAPFLCKEALSLIQDIESGLIDEANLKHVLEELSWSIQHDPIAQELLDLQVNAYLPTTYENLILPTLKRKLDVLERSLTPYRYLHRCFDALMMAVQDTHKKPIDLILKNIITTLINIGISKKSLYEKTQNHFFTSDGPPIEDCNILATFLKEIYPQPRRFIVYHVVSDLICQIKDSIKAFNMEIIEELPQEVQALALKHNMLKSSSQCYVVVNAIKEFDIYSAQEAASTRLDQVSDLFTLFHHRQQINYESTAIVTSSSGGILAAVTITKGAMDKPFDLPADKASKDLNRLVKSIGLNGSSFERFNRVADLHGVCVATDIVENQLVNLWTALETLIPTRMKGAKVANVVEAMIPFLMTTYFNRIIGRLGHDLITWKRWTIKSILNKVPDTVGGSVTQKLLALLCVQTNQPLRDELYTALGDFHLLRFRIFSIAKIFSSPNSTKKALEKHEKLVRWQIRRIYRTRNLIVHSGAKPTFIHGLVENGHDYLDLILFEIMKFACGDYRTSTLEQAFDLATMKYEKFSIQLSETASFDALNCQFLGSNKNALADIRRQPWGKEPDSL
ncbi:hypothetical protein J3D48_004140 [Pseudomonas fluorescens]|uniref:hypothetical protein n=1 Tax=Pseudomonas fluorescens TaxID=294 RepID=UPI00209CE28B|nr:hypothetical protein [Pseudomonas fluorescens]MCP1487827.1 hypothetical protein [Pseudomonas fluorescens]